MKEQTNSEALLEWTKKLFSNGKGKRQIMWWRDGQCRVGTFEQMVKDNSK